MVGRGEERKGQGALGGVSPTSFSFPSPPRWAGLAPHGKEGERGWRRGEDEKEGKIHPGLSRDE